MNVANSSHIVIDASNVSRWRVGEVEFDVTHGCVIARGKSAELDHVCFLLLRCLISHCGEVVTKETLMQAAWPNRIVGENSLAKAISRLRAALHDNDASVLRSIHGYGYCLMVAEAIHHKETSARWQWRSVLLATVLIAGSAFAIWLGRPVSESESESSISLSPAPTALAVLPLANRSPDQVADYVADGLVDELLNRLAQNGALKVVARTSAFQFKDKNIAVGEIGRQLNVSHVLEGGVQQKEGRLKISLQLVDCASGFPLWAQAFEHDPADPNRMQDAIVSAVTSAMKVPSGRQSAINDHIAPAAYDHYLRGRVLLAQRVDGKLQQAVAAFDQAIALAPTYSQAHSGRGFALAASAYWGAWLPTIEAVASGRAAADEALRYDPDNAEAYLVRATTKLQRLQIDAARVDYERALTLAPSQINVINYYGDFLRFVGELREAENLKRRAMENDPLFFVHPRDLSDILRYQGRDADALVMAEKAVALGGGRWSLEAVFWAQLRLAKYEAAQTNLTTLCPATTEVIVHCFSKQIAWLAAAGQREAAVAQLRRLESHELTPNSSIESYAARAVLYVNSLEDFELAAQAMRAALAHDEVWLMGPLLNAPGGAKLPEEMSQSTAWLAVWNEPKLAELMRAYRRNLLAFRNGGGVADSR